MGNFNHLPTDILLDIITRLPAESILYCKSVCKQWNLVYQHPYFSHLHHTYLNQSADSGKLGFIVVDKSLQLQYFEYNENNDGTPIHSIRRFNFSPPFKSPYYHFVGSLNGLVCLYGWRDDAYCICNPVTREYVMLPKIKRDRDDWHIHCSSGFGYLPLTKEYKVVELYKLRGEWEVSVYTLGDGNRWRNVGWLDAKNCDTDAPGVFVNGTMHWMDRTRGTVFAFNLTEEKFREHLSPPPLPRHCTDINIGVLGGRLYCAIQYHHYPGPSDFDIWLLKERNGNLDMSQQVEHELCGWRKEFSRLERQPLTITKSGGAVCFDKFSLSIDDPITLTSKELLHFTGVYKIIPHKNTLVSMKEIGEEDVKIMESAAIRDKKQ